jgi:hypothetical protein
MKVVVELWRCAPWWRRVTLAASVCGALALMPSRRVATPTPPTATPSTAATAAPSAAPTTVSPTPQPTSRQEPAPRRNPPGERTSGALAPSRVLREGDLPPPPQPKDDTPVFRGKDPRLRPSGPAELLQPDDTNDSDNH